MMWLRLAERFFRLGPVGLGLIAVVIAAAGYFIQVKQDELDARTALMLAAGAPDLVDIADFSPKNATEYDEVMVQAELVWDHSYDLWYEEDFGNDYVVMFPLVAPGSANTDTILGVAILQAENGSFDTYDDETWNAVFVGDGKFGPIANLNGTLDDLGKWQGLTEESFYDEGLQLPANPIIIWPFVQGRDVALAPPDPDALTLFAIFSMAAGAVGLLALVKLVLGRRSDKAPKAPDPIEVFAKPETSDVPLWKQRSGFAETGAQVQEPATFEPQTSERPAVSYADISPPKRSGFGFRKVLIVIVGSLFMLGLSATVYDLIKTSSSAPAPVVSAQGSAAQSVADAIVPDADPNRHWTDIDVTPIIEWVVAQALLAFGGDSDAQINLAMLGGGVFLFMFMVRWFFVMRVALRPKTSTRFTGLGLD